MNAGLLLRRFNRGELLSFVLEFSLLAALGSGDHDDKNPASPPSTSVSPAMSKAVPAPAEKSDDKKED